MIDNLFTSTARANSDRTAVIDGQEHLSYQDLNWQKQRFTEYLARMARIGPNQRVAVFLPNCVEFILSFLSIAKLGAVCVPINVQLREKELRSLTERLQISTVITNESYWSLWHSVFNSVQGNRIILTDDWRATKLAGDASANMAAADRKAYVDEHALYLCTSGSTGKPKVVARSHRNIAAGPSSVGEALGVGSADKVLSVTPFFHANGFSNGMIMPLVRGATVVLNRRFTPRELMVQMRQERITVLFGSPIVFSALADQPADSQALKSLRVCISTGARLTASVTTAILEKFGVRVQQLYGSSEAGTIAIQCRQAPDSSIGRPLKNVDVKILDIDGTHVGPMESGEIAIKSPAMTRGYVCESALNDETYHQGYLRTGDVGKIDRQGNLYVTGRIKRLINMSGVKVDPVEIEDVLKTHQKVKDAFVFGVNNHREIQVIKALIVADAECRCNEIVKHCRENLAEFKIPRIVEFVQQIPTDIMGKRNPDPKPFGV